MASVQGRSLGRVPGRVQGMGKASPAGEPSVLEYQGGLGGLYVVRDGRVIQVATVIYWKLTYESQKDEHLGTIQTVEIIAEQLCLWEPLPKDDTVNALMFRGNVVYVIGRATLVGMKDSEEIGWRDMPTPWDRAMGGPWLITSNLMIPPTRQMRSDSWDKAVKEGDQAKMVEIITLAEAWERQEKMRREKGDGS